MKTVFYVLLILVFTENLFSQITDTCFVGETGVYHVKNQKPNSLLYWEVSDGDIMSENPSQTDSIVILWNTADICELSVYEKTGNNCMGEIAITEIMVIENDFDIEFDIPNVFSPNGDGANDYFTIKANILPENYHLSILTRWGNVVFETENINNSWNGRIKNELCSSGVYYYVIRYKNGDKIETKKGSLHLFK